MTTPLRDLQRGDFDYLLNGKPGAVPGIALDTAGPFGIVKVDTWFRQNYKTPWPALLEVRYLQNGVAVSSGVLELLDLRQATPARMRVDVSNTLQIKPAPYLAFTDFVVTLFDADGIPFPVDPTGWSLHVVDPPEGVEPYGQNQLMVRAHAPHGPIAVRVSSQGFEETVTITLIAAPGIQSGSLYCEPDALYVPTSTPHGSGVMIKAKQPGSTLDFTLNGVPGDVTGISLETRHDVSFIIVDAQFGAGYTGPWPALIEIREWRGDIIIDTAALRLLDPRNALVERITASLKPHSIPLGATPGWTATCWLGVRMYDLEGTALPPSIPWKTRLLDTPPGVSVVDNTVLITHEARPGNVRVVAEAPNGVHGYATLQLTGT